MQVSFHLSIKLAVGIIVIEILLCLEPLGQSWQILCRGPLNITPNINILAAGLMLLEILFKIFPIISPFICSRV